MISIIICSREIDIPQDLRSNISSTVGCPFELIVIDNSNNNYNICQAYNEGIRRSTGDTLCFIHDDILFHTPGWGTIVDSHLAEHTEVGAIGFLGGHYLPQRPCYWSEPRVESTHYIQGETLDGLYSTRKIDHHKYRNGRTFVAAIDGVFIAIRRKTFEKHCLRWDEITFPGFHFYDADMCMQIHSVGLKIEVLWDIWMEHKSCGNMGAEFLKARLAWYTKWKDSLPVICGVEMTDEDIDICRIIMDITDQSYKYLQIRESLAYRLGKALLHPSSSNLRRLFTK